MTNDLQSGANSVKSAEIERGLKDEGDSLIPILPLWEIFFAFGIRFYMKNRTHIADDELRPEYDLRELLKGGVRGKYVERYRAGTNLVLLDPDVAKAFPNERAVNEALRLVLELKRIPEAKKRTTKA